MRRIILFFICIVFITSYLPASTVEPQNQPGGPGINTWCVVTANDTTPRKVVAARPGKAKANTTPGKAITHSKLAPLILEINVVPEAMKYDTKLIKVKAGQKVIININNHDTQQHNLVIAKIGSFNKVGEAANVLAADPKGIEKDYVPEMPEILYFTPLLDANASYALEFTAPTTRGDYPYMCTFPGHWMMMNGIMKVE